ncbi:cystatin-11 isoform X3 [Mesocricetus auratus]|uniref:Cystatin-11 isoform X3 n=1 Tax=Mesocricetus auratus TaxID=10036 RepID=A0ABM2XIS8_MESAU|nr:cystatin-11 isoform X3 [Mesocricetus auratus]
MMLRPWKASQLLFAILVALVAFSYQQKKKTFIIVREVNVLEPSVPGTLEYVTNAYNKESEDVYNFRILRILKIEKQKAQWGEEVSLRFPSSHSTQLTDHLEFHIRVEMRRTTCFKTEKSTCDVQKGALYKSLTIRPT